MKFISRFIALFAVLLVGIVALPVLAAPTTLVVTEAQINPLISGLTYTYGTYKVSNPSVDFRMTPGVVRINATVTQNGVAKAGRVVLSPVLSGGKLGWKVESATLNGQPGTGAQFAFVQSTLTGLWTTYMNTYYSGTTVLSVLITETKITSQINN